MLFLIKLGDFTFKLIYVYFLVCMYVFIIHFDASVHASRGTCVKVRSSLCELALFFLYVDSGDLNQVVSF